MNRLADTVLNVVCTVAALLVMGVAMFPIIAAICCEAP